MPDLIPFEVAQVWHQGRPLVVAEPRSTLGLVITAATKRLAGGTRCCLCVSPIRSVGIECITVAVAHVDEEVYRVSSRAYCVRCAPADSDAAEAAAHHERGAIPLRFRVKVPPSTAYKPKPRNSNGI